MHDLKVYKKLLTESVLVRFGCMIYISCRCRFVALLKLRVNNTQRYTKAELLNYLYRPQMSIMLDHKLRTIQIAV